MQKSAILKSIPNCLSMTRIVLSLVLLLVEPLGTVFYVLYVICGASDILDGFIARKTGTSSKFGARLDTMSDMILTVVLFIRLFPLLVIPVVIIIWVLAIGMLRILSIVTVFKKYGVFAILHTYTNKLAGFTLLFIPIFMNTLSLVWMTVICCIASLSAVEELLINLTSKELDLDKKSILF